MYRLFIFLLAFVFAWTGCSSETPFRQGPPDGWEGAGAKWWLQGQDTTGLFRDLETLEAMNVISAPEIYLANASQGSAQHTRQQFTNAVKRSLIRMYRNQPAIVDSLFEEYLAPRVQDVQFTDDPVQDVDKFKKSAYKLLGRHFREPRTRLTLGTDVPVLYPDSLRAKKVEGAVSLQVYLNAEGEPLTLELIESVHPVLDQQAMEATTRMRWIPAYVMEKRDWKAIPAWARFRITFSTEQN